jgi:hypothetical protein
MPNQPNNSLNQNDYDIVPVHLAVKAMQDNGYKSPAYAVAELIDNSIQAGATSVELLCLEETDLVQERQRSRIKSLGVLDNGSGMDANTVRMALQFGNGMYLDYSRHTGIGRFGMGLPCSSVSQAQKVEVWTWQKGVDSAIYTYLDVDEINNRQLGKVPVPTPQPIPAIWRTVGKTFGKSGTLVVWSRMNRCVWRTSRTIIDNSEFLIGRIYRKFISCGKAKIRMAAFDMANPQVPLFEPKFAAPNDPIYLMANTSCPPPYDSQPMFEQWGSDREFTIRYRDIDHKVIIRFTIAKKEAREPAGGGDAGRLPHGKHADRNIGVSIVRADRELDLDPGWAIKYDPRERWWGVELEFPAGLDDMFGVTNNKQAAHHFSELAKVEIDELLRDGKTIHELMDEWKAQDDPRGPLLEIAQTIQKGVRALRESIKEQRRGARAKKRHDQTLGEEKATAATTERKHEGHAGVSDKEEERPKSERIEALAEDIAQDGTPSEEAERKAAEIIDRGLKYEIMEAKLETPAFFSVKQVAGILKVTLNTDHPAYENLVEVLEEDVEGVNSEELSERLQNARDGLKLLLTAWARYEDEQPDGKRRAAAQDARTDWGRVARNFLSQE